MADDARQYPPPPLPSRLGMRHHVSAAATDATTGGCGEIVEVQGGHIVRSTGRKDRHSKVCTAKGPRDRRVRLSAHTAIQFYDVQDRLGFDRPSKAVDWLIKKAKTSIDELAELPPWNPVDAIRHAAANAKPRRNSKSLISQPQQIEEQQQQQQQNQNLQFDVGGSISARGSVIPPAIGFHQSNDNESSFLPPSMDSDSIADTIKSFFPVASTEAPPQLIQSYHHHHHPQPPPDLLSRTNSQNQDLRLSLQSFQDNPPLLLHQQHASSAAAEPVMFYGQSNLGFDTSTVGWENSHHHHHHNHQLNHQSPEFGRIQRLVAWNSGGAADTGNGGSGGGFLFASPSTATTFQPGFGQSQLFSQRGPLQSSYTPMIRAWFDPHHHHHHNHHQSISTATTTDDLNHHHIPPAVHQSAIPGIGFASGEFSGFRIPARFQGEEEEHDGINNKPSSAPSISRH